MWRERGSVQSRMRPFVLDQKRAASGMVTCCRSVSSGLLIQSRPVLSRLFDKPITRPGNRAVHLLGCGIVLGVKADEAVGGFHSIEEGETAPHRSLRYVPISSFEAFDSRLVKRVRFARWVRGDSLARKFIYGITGAAISNWHDSARALSTYQREFQDREIT